MCKNHNGVLGGVVGILFLLIGHFVFVDSAMAQMRPTQASYTRTTQATKGVRTTAYAKRRVPRVPIQLPPETSATEDSLAIVERAKSMVGVRYRWGGTDQRGFDCSGLARFSLGDKAAHLPRSSHALHASMAHAQDLRPGDLIFFGRGRTSHVAVYIGDRKVVHASMYGRNVREDSLDRLVVALGYRGVGRI